MRSLSKFHNWAPVYGQRLRLRQRIGLCENMTRDRYANLSSFLNCFTAGKKTAVKRHGCLTVTSQSHIWKKNTHTLVCYLRVHMWLSYIAEKRKSHDKIYSIIHDDICMVCSFTLRLRTRLFCFNNIGRCHVWKVTVTSVFVRHVLLDENVNMAISHKTEPKH